MPDQVLRVKASIKFIEKTAKLPDGWDLVKELSQRIVEVPEMTLGINWLRSNYSIFVIGWHLVNFSLNLTTCLSLSLSNWTFQEGLVSLEVCPTHPGLWAN
jgi:hypothetical protein